MTNYPMNWLQNCWIISNCYDESIMGFYVMFHAWILDSSLWSCSFENFRTRDKLSFQMNCIGADYKRFPCAHRVVKQRRDTWNEFIIVSRREFGNLRRIETAWKLPQSLLLRLINWTLCSQSPRSILQLFVQFSSLTCLNHLTAATSKRKRNWSTGAIKVNIALNVSPELFSCA